MWYNTSMVEKAKTAPIFQEEAHEQSIDACVFCRIVENQEPASVLFKDEVKRVISFMDLQGYPLVCPMDHIDGSEQNITDNHQQLVSVFDVALQLLPSVKSFFRADGINIVVNLGEAAGQEISHFHVHLIPRLKEDKVLRILCKQTLDRSELNRRANLIKEYMDQKERVDGK